MKTLVFVVTFLISATWGFLMATLIPSWWCLLPAVIGGLVIGIAGSAVAEEVR